MDSSRLLYVSKAELHLREMASRFKPGEEVVVLTDKGFYIQMNNGKKAHDAFVKHWDGQDFDNRKNGCRIHRNGDFTKLTVVELADEEEFRSGTKKPSDTAQGSDSDKAGASMKA